MQTLKDYLKIFAFIFVGLGIGLPLLGLILKSDDDSYKKSKPISETQRDTQFLINAEYYKKQSEKIQSDIRTEQEQINKRISERLLRLPPPRNEAQLKTLQRETKRLKTIYENSPTLANENEYKAAWSKELELQWEIYPHTKPLPSPRTTVDDLEDRIDDLEDELDSLR